MELTTNWKPIAFLFFHTQTKKYYQLVNLIKKIQEEITRVKNLPDDHKAGWVVTNCPDGTMFLEDSVSELKMVGKTTRQKLKKSGIHYTKDLIFLDLTPAELNQRLQTISKSTTSQSSSKISTAKLCDLHQQAKNAYPGTLAPQVNHQTHVNLYLSPCGKEYWVKEIKKVSNLKKYCNIRDLVLHHECATQEFFKDTDYKDTYLF